MNNNSSPNADESRIDSDARNPSPWARWTAVIGTAVASAIYVGMVLLVSDVLEVFQRMASSGSDDAQIMAAGISRALVNVIVAGVFGSVGLIIVLLTVWFSPYRARWFFWTSLLLAITYLLFIPIAAVAVVFVVIPVLAAVLVILLIAKRREFFQRSRSTR